MRRILRLTPSIFVLAATFSALAQDSILELTPEQRQDIETGRDPGASFGDPAFDALTEHTRAWGVRPMHDLAVDSKRHPIAASLDEILALLSDPDASAGEPIAIFARFAERQPVPKYANWQRWLVEPVDPANPNKRADRAVILFIDRTVSAIPTEPRKDWYISAVVRFYKPLELPNRMTGEMQQYPAFVGAVYDVRPRLGAAPASVFAIVGLGIAFMVAALVSLLVIVNKIRSGPSYVHADSAAPTVSEESDLPSDPAEALARLADDADPRNNGPHA